MSEAVVLGDGWRFVACSEDREAARMAGKPMLYVAEATHAAGCDEACERGDGPLTSHGYMVWRDTPDAAIAAMVLDLA